MLWLVAPPACLVCRAPAARGAVLCPPCTASLPWIDAACPRCALPRCGPCPHAGAPFAAAYAPMAHAGVARDLLLALKLRRALPAATAMAEQILRRLPPGGLDGATLVPIPSWTSLRLAEALGRAAGCPVTACLRPAEDRATRQLARTRAQRGARGRLQVTTPAPAAGPLVLVDDVHTTGATLRNGAGALRGAGFPQIAVVTYVRTLATA